MSSYRTRLELTKLLITSYGIVYSHNEKIGEKIWGDFVPNALASGNFRLKLTLSSLGVNKRIYRRLLIFKKAGVSAKKACRYTVSSKKSSRDRKLECLLDQF